MKTRTLMLGLAAASMWMPMAATAEQPALQPDEKAFVEAFNRNEREPLADYIRWHYSAAALAAQSVDQRVAELQKLQRQFGRLTPVEASGVSRIAVLSADSSRSAHGVDIVLLHNDSETARIDNIWIHPVTETLADTR